MLERFRKKHPPADVAAYPPVEDADLDSFAQTIYGKLLPQVAPSFAVREQDGHKVVDVKVSGPFGDHSFPLHVYGTGQKAFLLIDHRLPKDYLRVDGEFLAVDAVVGAGFALAVFHVADVAPDKPETYRKGVLNVFNDPSEPLAANAAKAIGAWSWAAMRAMDYLQNEFRQVAMIGHSRGGKAALWAGGNDARFPLVISSQSGSTGAKPARRCNGSDGLGEDIATINKKFPHWFADNYRAYDKRDTELPMDQHQLLALIKPRQVVVASATQDRNSDPAGEELAASLAGVEYRIREGTHALNQQDWRFYLEKLAALP